MARVVAVANQQSGSGKTRTALALSRALAAADRRVLLVDLDAQAHLTRSLGVDPDTLSSSVHDVLVHRTRCVDAMVDTDELVDVLPASIDLAADEATLVSSPGRENLLRSGLADVADDYDFIIIDCGPTLGIITLNALAAATDILIPMRAVGHSQRAYTQLRNVIEEVRRFVNPDLRILDALLLDQGSPDADSSVAPIVRSLLLEGQ